MIAKRGLARNWMRAVISFLKMKEQLCIEEISVSEVGEKYGALRIVSPRADAAMVKSIRKYGQISPVVCVKGEGRYELIDGFKRLRACRRLDQPMGGNGRVEHRRSKFRLRTFRFQPFRLLVPKSLKPCPCFLCPL